MKNKHIGSNVIVTLNEWENDPAFKTSVQEHIEKAKLGKMLKEVRRKEHLTQTELAEMAQVPQSVIARIETGSSRTLPRIDLFNKILSAAGYETHIIAKKKKKYGPDCAFLIVSSLAVPGNNYQADTIALIAESEKLSAARRHQVCTRSWVSCFDAWKAA